MTDAVVNAPDVPRHIGIIMDGNGRWAEGRGLPRSAGHRAGARTVRRTVEAAGRIGVRQLTLYAFSSENWERPQEEVSLLMRLFARFLRSERGHLWKKNVRFRAIGRLDELPTKVRFELQQAMWRTAGCTGLTLCLAVNYGGRNELIDACRKLAARVAAGELTTEEIEESTIIEHLYQPDMPPLDLVIRTAGEMRLSNFLLWQAAYAEFWSTPVPWPDFSEAHLRSAIQACQARTRRFGGLPRVLAMPPLSEDLARQRR